ncbi:hypothetical protein I7I50_07027 [Histoplasma capsulatum G186AR]|uniref:Uncharacterized protein n=1 Tax=Ajellomyces capsulatus TaxID=5037 RepID=A0A8H7YYI4_AJECA|nr:hypothetical protein I7I52_09899 [Histoplasma capsulatum]QSS67834.1 hypothetical protein I7I50_07027 [Histoplasma capsulatum G186AR]
MSKQSPPSKKKKKKRKTCSRMLTSSATLTCPQPLQKPFIPLLPLSHPLLIAFSNRLLHLYLTLKLNPAHALHKVAIAILPPSFPHILHFILRPLDIAVHLLLQILEPFPHIVNGEVPRLQLLAIYLIDLV